MVALPRQVSSSLGQVEGVVLTVYDTGVKLREQRAQPAATGLGSR